LKFINKKPRPKNTNWELIKMSIPKPIRDKVFHYQPTNDLTEIQSVEFKPDLTPPERTQFLSMFPELKKE